ncbi:MAG TPA: hypothetical protein VIK86_01395 [Candidatus Paceibacterota bacterium]
MVENLYYDIETKKHIEGIDDNFNFEKMNKPTFYDTQEFHKYHEKFTDMVYRIVFTNKNKYVGYCYIGIKDNVMKAPYSSPFSMIYFNPKYKINDICNLIKSLIECSILLNCKKIIFSLPPQIYSEELINSQSASFFSNGFKVEKVDINNYFNLSNYTSKDQYLKGLIHSSRQNHNISIKNDLTFVEVPIKNFKLAYNVIKINREQMGYPLKISERQMDDLIKMESLTCRCFGVEKDDVIIASAIIFDVTDEISQVVYWGDVSEYRKIRPMALLSIEVFNYYKNLGKKYLDIGPSSEDGIINTGLADFKKSIGCDNNIKITYKWEMRG